MEVSLSQFLMVKRTHDEYLALFRALRDLETQAIAYEKLCYSKLQQPSGNRRDGMELGEWKDSILARIQATHALVNLTADNLWNIT